MLFKITHDYLTTTFELEPMEYLYRIMSKARIHRGSRSVLYHTIRRGEFYSFDCVGIVAGFQQASILVYYHPFNINMEEHITSFENIWTELRWHDREVSDDEIVYNVSEFSLIRRRFSELHIIYEFEKAAHSSTRV